MICLGYTDVEVSVELLCAGVVVGMDDSRFGHIADRIALLTCISGKDHVFVEDGPVCEASYLIIDRAPVHGTYIRAEVGLDPQALKVCLSLFHRLVGIVELPGVALCKVTVSLWITLYTTGD